MAGGGWRAGLSRLGIVAVGGFRPRGPAVDAAHTDVALADFAAIKQEIQHRSNAQLTLVGLNVTAVGAIGGFAISQRQTVLMLMLPILCPALGLFFLDHDRHIRAQGQYIRAVLWPRIARGLPTWEDNSEPLLGNTAVRRFYLVPLLMLFGGPSLAALLLVPLAGILFRQAHPDLSSIVLYGGLLVVGLPTFGLWCWASYTSALNPFRRRPAYPRPAAAALRTIEAKRPR
jgi:hypothetical protein